MTLPPPRADVVLMDGYHSPRLDVKVRLNVNEAPEGPPAAFLEALEREIHNSGLNRYPDLSATALREAIGAHHGVRREEVFCANGSNEVLQSLLLAFGGPGRAVAVFSPTYALHSHIAAITGTAVLEAERDEEFLIHAEAIEQVMARGAAMLAESDPRGAFGTRRAVNPVITFCCSPNNPTGRLEPDDRLDAVLARAPGLVVADEAYGQFAPRSALDRRGEHPELVVVRTFSKTWSLAGLRLGYAVADPAVIEAMERVTLPYHLDTIKQAAGRLALGFADEMRARVSRLVHERGRLCAELSALGCSVVPSDANFILFSPPVSDAKAVWSSLVEHSVLVRDVSSWPRLAGYLRVTVGTPEEDDAFLAGLRAAL